MCQIGRCKHGRAHLAKLWFPEYCPLLQAVRIKISSAVREIEGSNRVGSGSNGDMTAALIWHVILQVAKSTETQRYQSQLLRYHASRARATIVFEYRLIALALALPKTRLFFKLG